MKNLLLIVSALLVSTLFGQNNPPVAVNDTVYEPVKIGEFFTVNVTSNDYDPDGDSISVKIAWDSYSYTDSTITYFFDFSLFGGSSGIIEINYKIEDESGASGTSSVAKVVFMDFINNGFSFLDVNNISARFNAYGNHFWDMIGGEGAQYFYPKGGELHTIFNFTLWLGGIDENNQLRVAAERYQQIGVDYWTGPLSFNINNAWIDSTVVANWFKIWKLSKEEVEYHVLHWNDPGYEPIENILNWPAHGDPEIGQSFYLAPFIDTNSDSIYEPLQGDYPLIRGDQTLFFIFNDQRLHTESGSQPIGIEVHGFAYAFNAPEYPQLNNTTFLSYKIFNRSQHTIADAYTGLFSDLDIGYSWDDFVGCDVTRGAYYCYNSDDFDEDFIMNYDTLFGYGEYPPAQGIVVLGGPYMDADSQDNPFGGCDESINGVGFGDGVVDNERLGMNNFIYFNNTGSYQGDPQYDYQYYNYLKGIWKDSLVMQYGGNGHPSSGAYGPAAHFMFPGLSDPCYWGTEGIPPYGPVDWTEVTAGNTPDDRRGLSSMGPFTLEPGAFHKIDIAFVTARGDSLINSVDLLMSYIDSVKTFYYQDPDHFGFNYLGENEISLEKTKVELFPNPASTFITINYSPASKSPCCTFYDNFGKEVYSEILSNAKQHVIPIISLVNGLYIVKIIDGDLALTQKFIKR
jgi:hypothetical protein